MTPHFFCDRCGQGFETRRQLNTHLPIHRNEVFACRKCEKAFVSNTKLKNHVRDKHCGSRFAHLTSLNNHLREVHEKGIGENIKGQFCEKTYHKRSLKRHEMSCKVQTNPFATLHDETVVDNDDNDESQSWQCNACHEHRS